MCNALPKGQIASILTKNERVWLVSDEVGGGLVRLGQSLLGAVYSTSSRSFRCFCTTTDHHHAVIPPRHQMGCCCIVSTPTSISLLSRRGNYPVPPFTICVGSRLPTNQPARPRSHLEYTRIRCSYYPVPCSSTPLVPAVQLQRAQSESLFAVSNPSIRRFLAQILHRRARRLLYLGMGHKVHRLAGFPLRLSGNPKPYAGYSAPRPLGSSARLPDCGRSYPG